MSSWIAIRVFPSSHTNPIFVEVDGKPIRASKRSAQWCLDAVDTCWNQKVKQTASRRKEAAAAAYDVARKAYAEVLAEAFDDRLRRASVSLVRCSLTVLTVRRNFESWLMAACFRARVRC